MSNKEIILEGPELEKGLQYIQQFFYCCNEADLRKPPRDNPTEDDKYGVSGVYKQMAIEGYLQSILVKKIESRYGYNENLEWVEIYHSELNLLD